MPAVLVGHIYNWKVGSIPYCFVSELVYCPGSSKRGRDLAHLICAGKQEARPLLFLNFGGTPPQEEHNTTFSGFKIY